MLETYKTNLPVGVDMSLLWKNVLKHNCQDNLGRAYTVQFSLTWHETYFFFQ